MTDYDSSSADSSLGPGSLSRAFTVLADTRRRQAVRYLHQHRSLSLATLADGVAEREAGVPLQGIDACAVRDVYFSLYHTHVPVLESANVVRYEQERDWVTCRDTRLCDLVFSLLDALSAPR
jgi:hypothetical protein